MIYISLNIPIVSKMVLNPWCGTDPMYRVTSTHA